MKEEKSKRLLFVCQRDVALGPMVGQTGGKTYLLINFHLGIEKFIWHPISESGSTVLLLLLLLLLLRHAQTGWAGELWSKTNLLKWQN